jgi:hypothetical protein
LGGLDASTLCSIKYGDIAEGLADNEHPLKLELQTMVNSLLTENMDLKNHMQQVERKLEDIGKTISEMRKILD